MYRRLESLGSRLLGAFVPAVDASAAEAQWCQTGSWLSCWQCGGGPCTAYCCNSWTNCWNVDCYV